MDDLNGGATITALANTSESDSLTINKNITINPNGKTLTRNSGYCLLLQRWFLLIKSIKSQKILAFFSILWYNRNVVPKEENYV